MGSANKKYTEYIMHNVYNISNHIQLQGMLNKFLSFNWSYNVGQPVVVVIDEKKAIYKDILYCINDSNLTDQDKCLFINKYINKMNKITVDLFNPTFFDTAKRPLSDIIITNPTSVINEEYSVEYVVDEDLNISNILNIDTVVDNLSKHRCVHYSFETHEKKRFIHVLNELYHFMLKLGTEFKNCSFAPVLYNNFNNKANFIDVVIYKLEDVIPVYTNVEKNALCVDIKIYKKDSSKYPYKELYSRFATFSKIKQGVFEIDGIYINNYRSHITTEYNITYELQELPTVYEYE